MNETLVVVGAHAFEARAAAAVGREMGREPWGHWMLYRGELWDHPYAVIRTGPGKASMAAAVQAAIQYLEPALVVGFGVAGCPDPKVGVGTLVVASRVVDVALAQLSSLPVTVIDRWDPDVRLRRCFESIPGTVLAPVLSWEGHVASPIHRPAVNGAGPGPEVVDWESAALANVCDTWDVPWGALRVVSDHGEADRLRRLAVVARRPLQWGAEVLRRACHEWFDLRGDHSEPRYHRTRGGGEETH